MSIDLSLRYASFYLRAFHEVLFVNDVVNYESLQNQIIERIKINRLRWDLLMRRSIIYSGVVVLWLLELNVCCWKLHTMPRSKVDPEWFYYWEIPLRLCNTLALQQPFKVEITITSSVALKTDTMEAENIPTYFLYHFIKLTLKSQLGSSFSSPLQRLKRNQLMWMQVNDSDLWRWLSLSLW